MTTPTRRPRSLSIPGVTHGGAPIPMGARVGNIIYSSGIAGNDPATDKIPAEPQAQARFMFQNVGTLLAQGGASFADVVRMTVYLKEESLREHVNREWVAAFPDPKDRPARHTQIHPLRGTALMQVEIVAVVQDA
jgi:2-iminobutanoate/2-iminopropanoate deaminase